jgi:hypothetical protein
MADLPKNHKKLVAGIRKEDFLSWLHTAQPGERISYFRGHNLGDADWPTTETAMEARQCFARGEIELVQARDTDRKLSYMAIKRREVRRPLVNCDKWRPHIDWSARVYPR